MDAEAKERLVDEFRAALENWDPLDDATDDGAANEPPVNLALLFAELSVLRNEVRVQARHFKTALDDMRALTELLGEQNKRLTSDLERTRETQGVAQRQTERRLLLDMLDVRDRIAAAVAVYHTYSPSFLSRFAVKEMQLMQSLGGGIELTLQRLDTLLTEQRVRPIDAVGSRLDPNTMRVVGVEFDAHRAPGEVLTDARRGFMRGDELLRLAEVIVNKREIQS